MPLKPVIAGGFVQVPSAGGGASLPNPIGQSGKFLGVVLDVPTWVSLAGGGDMLAANNLSDLVNAAIARTNLGLGSAAVLASTAFDAAGAAAAAQAASQPVAAPLTAFAALADSAGVLTNNGSGTLSYTATATGGNGSADYGKLAAYGFLGSIAASYSLDCYSITDAGRIVQLGYSLAGQAQLRLVASPWLGNETTLRFAEPSGSKVLTIPATTGTLITTGDTGTVTNAMLAGSIDLATKVTGTLPVANGGTLVKAITTGKKTDTATVSGTTWTTVYSVTHNVQVSGSLLSINFAGAGASTTGGYNNYVRIRISSTTLAEGDAAGSRTLTGVAFQSYAAAALQPFSVGGYYTTTATGNLTIELQMRSDSGGTAYLNRTVTDSDTSSFMRSATTVQVIEYVNP